MKICILTPRFPLPESGGDLLRINNIARHLKSMGHNIILVSYTSNEQTPSFSQASEIYDKIYTTKRYRIKSALYSALFLLKGAPIQCGYYYSRTYLRLFRRVIKEETPDLYISHLIRMVPFIEKAHVREKTIVEMTDALSITYSLVKNAKGSPLKRFMYHIERHFIGRFEQSVARNYPKVVLVSQSDKDYLAAKLSKHRLALHTNGVNYAKVPRTTYDENKICFIGNMVSLQNQDAAIYFAEEIFPIILRSRPLAKFYIVGNNPPKSILNLGNRRHIIVTGYIEDIESFISDSCIAVAPIRIAAGIQNKILLAMANKLPVVMTSLVTAPIKELKNGENCLIADDAESFANSCLRLLNEPKLHNDISQKGYEMVKDHYSWESKLAGYEELHNLT